MRSIVIGNISVFIYLLGTFASNVVNEISETIVWNFFLILSSDENDSSIHQNLSYFK